MPVFTRQSGTTPMGTKFRLAFNLSHNIMEKIKLAFMFAVFPLFAMCLWFGAFLF